MLDTLHRYFVQNPAPIFSARRVFAEPTGRFVRCRCGNSDGFFWGRWQVTWRVPYSKVWAFDGKRWVPAYSLPTPTGDV